MKNIFAISAIAMALTVSAPIAEAQQTSTQRQMVLAALNSVLSRMDSRLASRMSDLYLSPDPQVRQRALVQSARTRFVSASVVTARGSFRGSQLNSLLNRPVFVVSPN